MNRGKKLVQLAIKKVNEESSVSNSKYVSSQVSNNRVPCEHLHESESVRRSKLKVRKWLRFKTPSTSVATATDLNSLSAETNSWSTSYDPSDDIPVCSHSTSSILVDSLTNLTTRRLCRTILLSFLSYRRTKQCLAHVKIWHTLSAHHLHMIRKLLYLVACHYRMLSG